MYIRFVIDKYDDDSNEQQGLFQAVNDLLYDDRLSDEEEKEAKRIFKWFNKNLPVPKRFSRSSKSSAKSVAISWFKPSAKEFIQQMQLFSSILYTHNIRTKIIKTRQPGYIVYEDEYQIVAQPFKGKK